MSIFDIRVGSASGLQFVNKGADWKWMQAREIVHCKGTKERFLERESIFVKFLLKVNSNNANAFRGIPRLQG